MRGFTKDDVYISSFEAIAKLPRAGLHHELVGRTAPYLFALCYSILPFPVRIYKNYVSIKNTTLVNVFQNSNVMGASLAGEVENM